MRVRRASVLLLLLALVTVSAQAAVLVYPWPLTAPVSDRYSVRLEQDGAWYYPMALYSEPNLEQGPDGDGVTGLHEDRSMTYVPFAFSGDVRVQARKLYGEPAQRVEITPRTFGIDPDYFDGLTVHFTLPDHLDPAYISINFVTSETADDDNVDANNNAAVAVRHGLVLFADRPEEYVPDLAQGGAVNYVSASREQIENADFLYFPPGDHHLGEKFGRVNDKPGTDARIYLKKDGTEIYLQAGAIVRGSIDGGGHDGIRLHGRGLITGEDFYWHYFQEPGSAKGKVAFLNFKGCDDCSFDGFMVVNPTHHTMPSANRTHTRNIKIIGWASNQDGIRPGDASLAEKVFIKTSDDLNYARNPGQVLRDSVVWPMRNGALGMLGWNNLGSGGTKFHDIYVIHSEWDLDGADKRNTGILGSVLNQGVGQAGTTVENLYGEWGMGMLSNISITFDRNKNPQLPDQQTGWGELTGFTFRNIILEAPFQNSGAVPVRNQLRGFEHNGARATLRDFRFVNVVAGNTLVTQENADQFFDIDPDTTSNISFTAEGAIHYVTVKASGGGQVRPAGSVPTPAGMDRYLSIIADEGRCIRNVRVDGQDLGRRQNVFFPDLSADHSVEVTFAEGPDLFGNGNTCGENMPEAVNAPFGQGAGMSGAWYDPARNGEGFLLENLPDGRSVLYWFTYDDAGGQDWYIAVGSQAGRHTRFTELLRFSGGEFGPGFDPEKVVSEVVGSARFHWSHCDSGAMEWQLGERGGRQDLLRISRLAGTACESTGQGGGLSGLSGSWFDPAHDGEGFVFEALDNGDALVYWFSYDPAGHRRWFFGLGKDENGVIRFDDMLTTSGARFGQAFEPEDVGIATWGSLAMEINCLGGTVRYTSVEPGFAAGQQSVQPLTKLLDCL